MIEERKSDTTHVLFSLYTDDPVCANYLKNNIQRNFQGPVVRSATMTRFISTKRIFKWGVGEGVGVS
jgi:hypothetical protein